MGFAYAASELSVDSPDACFTKSKLDWGERWLADAAGIPTSSDRQKPVRLSRTEAKKVQEKKQKKIKAKKGKKEKNIRKFYSTTNQFYKLLNRVKKFLCQAFYAKLKKDVGKVEIERKPKAI